jgi:hypothetical protein
LGLDLGLLDSKANATFLSHWSTSVHKVVGAPSPAQMPRAGKRPPVVGPPPQNNVPSNDRVSSAGTIDLERNSADAIAPAMTSSVLLPHHNAVGAECETPRNPPERTTLCSLANLSTRTHKPKGQPVQPCLSGSLRGHLCRFGFRGRRYLRTLSSEHPECSTWNRKVLPSSCGCQERNAICCILLRFRPYQNS